MLEESDASGAAWCGPAFMADADGGYRDIHENFVELRGIEPLTS